MNKNHIVLPGIFFLVSVVIGITEYSTFTSNKPISIVMLYTLLLCNILILSLSTIIFKYMFPDKESYQTEIHKNNKSMFSDEDLFITNSL